jgi:hypothetical protein
VNDKQPTPAPGWLPDPDGAPFLRWWDGKHWTKRVQGEPPRATVVKRDPGRTTTVVVREPLDEEPETEPDVDADAEPEHLSTHWPPLSVVAAVLSALGIVAAFLIPLGRLPLIVSAVGVAASVFALVLAAGEGQRRIVAVWGIGLGLVGVAVSLTVIEFG